MIVNFRTCQKRTQISVGGSSFLLPWNSGKPKMPEVRKIAKKNMSAIWITPNKVFRFDKGFKTILTIVFLWTDAKYMYIYL